MYKIMIVDDEGIVIDSLKFIIEKDFGTRCQVESAKTGRRAIELAESFRPDIAFMDIQMPGLDGIETMEEMKSRNDAIAFIVVSAYDKFSYAKQAIDLGVLEYLMKPFNRNKIVDVLNRTLNRIEERRRKISDNLQIKEKLRTVIPVLENGLIYTLMFQEAREEVSNYKNLLGIESEYGYMMILEYGDDRGETGLTNPVGASVRIQKIYPEIREVMKDFFPVYIGVPMANRITAYVSCGGAQMDYNTRIEIIEKARGLVRKLNREFKMRFKIGIGSVQQIWEMKKSYQEAVEAVHSPTGSVTHIRDVGRECQYEEEYPIHLEKKLFASVEQGNVQMARSYANQFFDWMVCKNREDEDSILLKVLEFALWAEHLAYESAGMSYRFGSRKNYLKEIFEMKDFEAQRTWFLDKISAAAENISQKEKKQASSLVEKASAYIQSHFAGELSLDDVSREINISPYYFSKLFKEETGENFVEYVTRIRIEHAKELLMQPDYSIKSICVESGFHDPNYFSRIFKKLTGLTPSEYREGGAYEG